MEIQKKEVEGKGIKFFIEKNGKEIGRAFLYLLKNDLHKEPFGLMEDVFVDELYRGKGYGKELIKAVIKEAKQRGCYKLIATSRHSREMVHKLYEELGFKNHGLEFRIDLS
jgi:GNAT superfamily N-acetyltransferase